MVTLGQPNNDYYLSHAFPVTLKLSLPPRITIEPVIITDQIKVIEGKPPLFSGLVIIVEFCPKLSHF